MCGFRNIISVAYLSCTFIFFSISIIIYIIIYTFELLNSPICLPDALSTYFKWVTCHPLMKASKANRPHTWVIRGKLVAISSAEQVWTPAWPRPRRFQQPTALWSALVQTQGFETEGHWYSVYIGWLPQSYWIHVSDVQSKTGWGVIRLIFKGLPPWGILPTPKY